ncbi:hypothetical protein KIPB_001441, partial [Kipferlia bialata]
GGSISYVEFREAPLSNVLGLADAVEMAQRHGVSYLGFNYPLDVCRTCQTRGTFDTCANCGSADIMRVRRVSGYLQDVDYFTKGKKAEIRDRRANE